MEENLNLFIINNFKIMEKEVQESEKKKYKKYIKLYIRIFKIHKTICRIFQNVNSLIYFLLEYIE